MCCIVIFMVLDYNVCSAPLRVKNDEHQRQYVHFLHAHPPCFSRMCPAHVSFASFSLVNPCDL